jgi:hypothetical protein
LKYGQYDEKNAQNEPKGLGLIKQCVKSMIKKFLGRPVKKTNNGLIELYSNKYIKNIKNK